MRLALSLEYLVCCLSLVSTGTALAQQPPKLRLAEVQDAAPTSYRVQLDLDPSKETFSGSIHIAISVKAPAQTLWLNTSQLTLSEIELTAGGKAMKGTAVPGGSEFTGLKFDTAIPAGSADLDTRYTGTIRHPQPAGIFVSEDNGNRYLLTQFETTDARDAFPCFDEPLYKVPWQLTLRVPASDAAISNTPVESESTSGEIKTVVFKQTKPLPSYLVAFGVGPFEFVDAGVAGKNHVPVRIVTPKGRGRDAQYAAEVTSTILTRLENYFGIPYPYEKADQVAIPISSGFAMENPGMVTYSGSMILAKPESDTVRRQREYASVAAHELAHQWFGDLVTTSWWNDVWLNEAFATWMEEKLISEWKPDWNTRASDVSAHLYAQTEDSLSSTRRIRQQIESMGDIDNAFDGITYQKGASVIGMFENWIGPEKFQSGVRNYLTQNAFKTATTADFLTALGAASGKDIKSAFSTFVDQPGIPVVSVALKCGNGSPTVTLEQSRFSLLPSKQPSDQLWSIPVCLRFGSGGYGSRQCILLTKRTGEITLDTKSCPAWVQANDKAVGYYRVDYRGDLLPALTKGDIEQRLSPAERVSLIGDAKAAADANLLPYSRALQLAAGFHADPVPAVISSALGLVLGIHVGSGDLVAQQALPAYQRFLSTTFGPRARSLGWVPKGTESEDEKLIRPNLLFAIATLGEDAQLAKQGQELAQKWMSGDRTLDPNVAGAVLGTAAYYGDRSTAERLLAIYKESKDVQDRSRILRAMQQFRDPVALTLGLQAWVSGAIPVSEGTSLITGGQYSNQTRMVPFEFVKTNAEQIMKVMPPLERGYLPAIGTFFCDAKSKNELQRFFEPKLQEIPAMRRTLAQAEETIDGCIARKQKQESALTEFLQGS